MATGSDYDTRRVTEDAESDKGFVERLAARRNDAASGSVDVDEPESTELPGGSYLDTGFDDELSMPVLPRRDDEFTCSRCFLIMPRRRHARTLPQQTRLSRLQLSGDRASAGTPVTPSRTATAPADPSRQRAH